MWTLKNNVDGPGPQRVVEPPPQGLFPLSDNSPHPAHTGVFCFSTWSFYIKWKIIWKITNHLYILNVFIAIIQKIIYNFNLMQISKTSIIVIFQSTTLPSIKYKYIFNPYDSDFTRFVNGCDEWNTDREYS